MSLGDRRHDADDRGLDDDRPDDLAPARTHRPQEAELSRALGDEDREGVEDDERRHDDADGGESEEHAREEVEELRDVLTGLGGRPEPPS